MLTEDQKKGNYLNSKIKKILTKRVTISRIGENSLRTAIPVLDHGFVRVVDYMGDDSSIVQAATSILRKRY